MKTKKNKPGELGLPRRVADNWTIDFSTYNDGYDKGIEAAASFVEQFDNSVNHNWRLSDCIRAKFNKLPNKKIRKNKRKHVIVGVWNK